MLSVQTLWKCTLIKKGKVNYKVEFPDGRTVYVKPDKFVQEDESICVVWMTYRGVEGSYRIEKELYPHRRRIAKEYPRQALVWEDSLGVENSYVDYKLE